MVVDATLLDTKSPIFWLQRDYEDNVDFEHKSHVFETALIGCLTRSFIAFAYAVNLQWPQLGDIFQQRKIMRIWLTYHKLLHKIHHL